MKQKKRMKKHLVNTNLLEKRVMAVAKADEVPETRDNVEILLNSLNLPELSKECQVVCDLKLCNLLLGIQSCSSCFGCPYCEGYKVDPETNKPTNGTRVWLAKDLRTANKMTECHDNWAKETNKGDMPVILLFPPHPLHLDYLGVASDAIQNAENKYPCEMR